MTHLAHYLTAFLGGYLLIWGTNHNDLVALVGLALIALAWASYHRLMEER